MRKLRYLPRLARDLGAFARAHKVYWIIPLLILLGIAALALIATQTTTPFLYTLF